MSSVQCSALALLIMIIGWLAQPALAQHEPRPDIRPTPVQTTALHALPEHWPNSWTDLHAAMELRAERLGLDYAELVIFNGQGVVRRTRFGNNDTPAPVKVLAGQFSELLTALTVMQLVERGEWSLFDRVQARLPNVAIHNPYAEQQPLLLIHLLEHSSGIDQRRFKSHFATNTTAGTDLVARLQREQQPIELRWEPGVASRQSSLNYALIAAMLEQYFQRPWAEVVHQYVVEPLGLESTALEFNAADSRVEGFHSLPPTPIAPRARVFTEAEGAWMDIDDIVTLGRQLLSRGASSRPAILRADSLATMEIPRSTQASDAGLVYGMGLGIDTRARYGLWHGRQSSLAGFSVNLRYRADHDIGYALVVNHESLLPALDELVWQYLATQLPPMPSRAGGVVVEQRWAGWYRLQNPEHQLLAPLQRVFNIAYMQHDSSYLTLRPLFGATVPLRSVDGSRLVHRQDGSVVGVLFSDQTGTQKLQIHNDVRYKVSSLHALGPPLAIVLALIILVTHPFGRSDSLRHPSMRRYTSLAGVCFILAAFVAGSLTLEQASYDNWRSVLLFIFTVLGPLFAVAGLYTTVVYWRREAPTIARARCLIGSVTAAALAIWIVYAQWFALRVWAW